MLIRILQGVPTFRKNSKFKIKKNNNSHIGFEMCVFSNFFKYIITIRQYNTKKLTYNNQFIFLTTDHFTFFHMFRVSYDPNYLPQTKNKTRGCQHFLIKDLTTFALFFQQFGSIFGKQLKE